MRDKMKNVLFVIETLRGGGAERSLSNIVTHFPDGWHIDILVNDDSLVEYPYKGNILSLSSPEKCSKVYFIKNMIKRTLFLRKLKRSNKYDVCVSFLEGPNISNVLSGKKYCRTIISIRNQIMPKCSGIYSKIGNFFLTTLFFPNADAIVAVSEEIAMQLVCQHRISEHKICAIVNGYDYEWIRGKMINCPQKGEIDKKLINSGKRLVVTVGRIVEQKGQWHLIRAFSDVVRREPNAVLLIVGDGLLRGYLERLIRLYRLEGKVILVGRSDNPFWYYANADVFVFPSLWEGYPNALAEALCCGAPCIATDVHSGCREILAPDLEVMGERVSEITEKEYGILVPVCSGIMYRGCEMLEQEEQKMADAIIMLLRDKEKRNYYREKSVERSKKLDINTVVSQWIDIM